MYGLPKLFKVIFCLACLVVLFLCACQKTTQQTEAVEPPGTPDNLPTNTPLIVPTTVAPTETPEPVPTDTPMPPATETPAPSPTPTMELLPTVSEQAIWVLFQRFGDAGRLMPKDYTDTFLPPLILYTDGLVIVTGDEGFQESQLSTTEMCNFLSALKNTGAFETQGNGELEVDDPIYTGINKDDFFSGSLYYQFTINGDPSRKYIIMVRAIDNLIPEVRALVDLVLNIKPQNLQPYQGEKHLLYISKDKDLADFYLEEAKPQNWPKGMPKLKELIGTSLDIELDLTPEQVAQILPYFNQLPGIGLFTQNEEEYFVVLRPVLPGEDKNLNFNSQSEASAFGLPFTCEP